MPARNTYTTEDTQTICLDETRIPVPSACGVINKLLLQFPALSQHPVYLAVEALYR